MDSNDVSDSVNNREIFKGFGIENNGGIVTSITSSLLILDMEGWVNYLERTYISSILSLVWESCINDDSIEMLRIGRS